MSSNLALMPFKWERDCYEDHFPRFHFAEPVYFKNHASWLFHTLFRPSSRSFLVGCGISGGISFHRDGHQIAKFSGLKLPPIMSGGVPIDMCFTADSFRVEIRDFWEHPEVFTNSSFSQMAF